MNDGVCVGEKQVQGNVPFSFSSICDA